MTTQRAYLNEQDKTQMAGLSRQSFAHNLHVIDLPWRFSSWAFDDPQNIRLWFDHKQLVAWAVMQTPFWTIDLACHADFEAQLHPEIIAWADQRAHEIINTPYGHPSWYINAFSGQADRIHNLEKAGFKCQSDMGEDSWSKVLLRRSSPAPVRVYAPPTGFAVRPLTGEDELQDYVKLQRAVFQSRNMTVEWRRRILQHPDHLPDLDLVVEDSDGHPVAFCICWFDEKRLEGQVEPLGCHEDFRRYALGRVALSEGLRRLQSLGTRNIYVETDNYRNTAYRLYESFGFEVLQDVRVYRKDYGDNQ